MKRNNLILFLIISKIICLFSCESPDIYLSEIELTDDTIINKLPDSSYLVDIRAIHYEKYLYLADYTHNKIFVFSEDGDFKKTIGREGKGPGEFMGVSQLFTKGDTIYAYDDTKRCFELYNYTSYLETIKIYNHLIFSYSGYKFFVRNNRIFLSAPSQDGSIISFSTNNYNHVNVFGRIIQFNSEKQTEIRNERHLFLYKDQIISVSDNVPVIERYDLKGELLTVFDYSNVTIVKEMLDYINKQESSENSYYVTVSDAYIMNDNLYLLITSNRDEKLFSNQVLVIKLHSDNMELQQIYNLGKGWFHSIGLTNKYLWAYKSAGLVRYTIDAL